MAFVDELGMTPMEALESATRKPAEFLGRADSVGSIKPGMVADLVLLDANQLQDIRNTTSIAGVVVRGTFYDRHDLDTHLCKPVLLLCQSSEFSSSDEGEISRVEKEKRPFARLPVLLETDCIKVACFGIVRIEIEVRHL